MIASKERAILDVARELFSLHGFKRTAVDDIASAAGVAKGTIYLYFESKDALFRSLCHETLHGIESAIDTAVLAETTALGRIGAALRTRFLSFVRVATSSPHGRELIDAREALSGDEFKHFNHAFEARIASFVEAGIASGEIAQTSHQLSPRALTKALLAASRGVGAVARDGDDFDRRFEALFVVLCEGIAPR